ncbi:hypothetical protein KIH27_13635 [Mycobacterium sp. M1]|uniref:Uncharacterized protein n=1 Tax=Mycolicibacter acidiphilus TaxID=2835306 RepID=A0ABS5RK13_9MYCO|nr:hypothetical protein [Mycolicibacter acidiphilus]MBS9534630.1 hypothetical protein [Mycolicibacter acidiphilus]
MREQIIMLALTAGFCELKCQIRALKELSILVVSEPVGLDVVGRGTGHRDSKDVPV